MEKGLQATMTDVQDRHWASWFQQFKHFIIMSPGRKTAHAASYWRAIYLASFT